MVPKWSKQWVHESILTIEIVCFERGGNGGRHGLGRSPKESSKMLNSQSLRGEETRGAVTRPPRVDGGGPGTHDPVPLGQSECKPDLWTNNHIRHHPTQPLRIDKTHTQLEQEKPAVAIGESQRPRPLNFSERGWRGSGELGHPVQPPSKPVWITPNNGGSRQQGQLAPRYRGVSALPETSLLTGHQLPGGNRFMNRPMALGLHY